MHFSHYINKYRYINKCLKFVMALEHSRIRRGGFEKRQNNFTVINAGPTRYSRFIKITYGESKKICKIG